MRIALVFGAAAVLAASPAVAQHDHGPEATVAGPGVSYGEVKLKNEGNAVAQRPFLEGLAHLHNFEYGRAARAFRQAQAADPGFVLAYWGEAMTHNHPLWADQKTESARVVLARLGPDSKSRRLRARSAREAMWLDAIEALYGEGTKADRDRAYHEQMRRLHESDPGDVDARAFYALSTLGLASSGRDPGIYMKAAAILEEAFPDNRRHPGILHYLIHSYDDTVHAPLGLRAARLYGPIAPGAGHAQHMTSHIYVPLGMWPESIAANVAAMAAVDDVRAQDGLGPTFCGHYAEWRVYSLYQLNRVDEAAAIVDRCKDEAAAELASGSDRTKAGGSRSLFNIWAVKAVRQGVDTGRWPDWSNVPAATGNLLGRFWLAYGRLHQQRGVSGSVASAQADLQRLGREVLAALAVERPLDKQLPRWVEQAMAQGDVLALAGTGRLADATAKLRASAVYEDGLPVEFGPPALLKPSWELLGDLLLASGDKAGAADAYRRMLVAAPGRRLSLEGLAAASR